MCHFCGNSCCGRSFRYDGCCPYGRLLELNRMCGCAPGVPAQVVSSCDCFCQPDCGSRSGGCGCRKR